MARDDSTHKVLIESIHRIARPIMRMCFRVGVSVGEVRAAFDHAAVREAERYLVSAGKKPTYSNISIITGIARHTVKHLLSDGRTLEPRSDAQMDRATRVVNGWVEDPSFLDRAGQPRELKVTGRGATIQSLVKRYAGGVGYAAILRRLIETNSVRVTEADAHGRPLAISLIRDDLPSDGSASRRLEEFGTTFEAAIGGFDLFLADPKSAQTVRPASVAVDVPTEAIPVVRRTLAESIDAIARSLRTTLRSFETSGKPRGRAGAPASGEKHQVRVSLLPWIGSRAPSSLDLGRSWRRPNDATSAKKQPRTDRANRRKKLTKPPGFIGER